MSSLGVILILWDFLKLLLPILWPGLTKDSIKNDVEKMQLIGVGVGTGTGSSGKIAFPSAWHGYLFDH